MTKADDALEARESQDGIMTRVDCVSEAGSHASTKGKEPISWNKLIAAVVLAPLLWYGGFVVVFGYSMGQQWTEDLNFALALLYYAGFFGFVWFSPLCALWVVYTLIRNFRQGVIGRMLALALFIALSWPAYRIVPQFVQEYYSAWRVQRIVAALVAGDSERAIKYADAITTLPERRAPRRDVQTTKVIVRAQALEMARNYDAALRELTSHDPEHERLNSFYARVYYRQGERARAFEEYCKFADSALKWLEPVYVSMQGYDSFPSNPTLIRQLARQRIFYFEDEYDAPNVMPFASYDEFLSFMEDEYAQTTEPERFKRALEFWRETARVEQVYFYRRNIRGKSGMLAVPNKFSLCDDEAYFSEWMGYLLELWRRNDSIATSEPPKKVK